MFLRIAVGGLILASSLTGCQARPTSAMPVGSSDHTLSSGGLTRSYIVYRPARLPARAPLVVMMHGGFGSAAQAEKFYHWDQEAATGHFIVAMVSAIEHALPVSAGRVYATGISNGGIMAYTLACRTKIFAAIGPDSATLLGTCPHPAPVSVIAIHGTADHNIPYNGGEGDGPGHIDGPSVPSVNAAWRRTDHCAVPTVTTVRTVTTSVAQCPAGRTVELITIAGAGHQWPGATPNPIAERLLHTDPPSKALNATKVIWQFFATHPR